MSGPGGEFDVAVLFDAFIQRSLKLCMVVLISPLSFTPLFKI